MKKTLFAIITAAFAVLSCTVEKSQQPLSESSPSVAKIPMTLTASIGPADTKVSMTEDNGMKATWDEEEQISLVSYDTEGHVLAIDIFTSIGEAGRTKGVFTGELSDVHPYKIICWYPAVDYFDTSEAYNIGSAPNEYGSRLFKIQSTGRSQSWLNLNGQYQMSATDCSHIAKNSLMRGEVVQNNGNLDVNIENCLSVLKIKMQLPASLAGQKVMYAGVWCDTRGFCDGGMFNSLSLPQGKYEEFFLNFGELDIHTGITVGITVPEDCKVDAYCLCLTAGSAFKAGDVWTIALYQMSNPVAYCEKTFKKDMTFEAGKMYTITADMQILGNELQAPGYDEQDLDDAFADQ